MRKRLGEGSGPFVSAQLLGLNEEKQAIGSPWMSDFQGLLSRMGTGNSENKDAGSFVTPKTPAHVPTASSSFSPVEPSDLPTPPQPTVLGSHRIEPQYHPAPPQATAPLM